MTTDATIRVTLSSEASPLLGTGHHFQFLEFPTNQAKVVEEITEAYGRGNCPWDLLTDDVSGRRLTWIRGRIQEGQSGRLGLLLCLDSNVGDSDRGWAVAPPMPVPGDTVQDIQSRAKSKESYLFIDEAGAPTTAQVRKLTFTPPPTEKKSFAIHVQLKMEFPHAVAAPVDVDLIIDFGNTRTVVLALEHNQSANGFLSQVCRPIEFFPRDVEPYDTNGALNGAGLSIIESWFVLAETLFSCLEPPSEDDRNDCAAYGYRITSETHPKRFWRFLSKEGTSTSFQKFLPQSCVQISPAIIGREAEATLPRVPLELGGNAFLSSPKRYNWDTEPVGNLGKAGNSLWTMHLNSWHPRFPDYALRRVFPKLSSSILLLMDESGTDWQLGPDGSGLPTERTAAATRPTHSPDAPAYPRSDALTWAAVTVLESAYRHIMSDVWRSKMQSKFVGRRLKNILVTFHSHPIGNEREAVGAGGFFPAAIAAECEKKKNQKTNPNQRKAHDLRAALQPHPRPSCGEAGPRDWG